VSPTDRRGLGEIISWVTLVVMTGLVAVVAMAMHDPSASYAVAIFSGAVAALLGRGTKAAVDRDAAIELRSQLDAERRRPVLQVERYKPPNDS
jgi:hypothetical protein